MQLLRSAPTADPEDPLQSHPLTLRRVLVMVALVALVIAVATTDALHAAVIDVLGAAERLIRAYPRGGQAVFLLLAALSATLTFFSSAALVPIGVFVWGPTTTFMLLWVGGTLGGVAGYWLARTLGRRLVIRLFPGTRLHRYERFFGTQARWSSIMLFRLALQSELPSYVLGLVRYAFPRYLLVIVLAELPYVFLMVYLGDAFLERNAPVFIAIFALGIVLTVWAWRRLQREMRASREEPGEAAPTSPSPP